MNCRGHRRIESILRFSLAGALTLCLVNLSWAQFPSRGGDSGGSRFGSGSFGGGPPGGSFGGGPPSGGSFSMPNPEEIIQRWDADRDGMIEPDEIEGRSRYFFERTARDAGLDPSKPIPADRLRQMMRDRMDRGSGGDSSRSGGSGDSRSSSSSSRTDPKKQPINTMAFGVTSDLQLVAGFDVPLGVTPIEDLSKKYSREVMERVDETFRRYDRNGTSILEKEEWANERWSDPTPDQFDKNKDGRISKEEMAERYKARENRDGQGSRDSGRSDSGRGDSGRSDSGRGDSGRGGFFFGGGGAPGSGGGPSGGGPFGGFGRGPSGSGGGDDRVTQFAEGTLNSYDKNKDGVLDKDEWSDRMKQDPSGYDKNGDGRIDKQELAQRFSEWTRGSSGGGSSGDSGSRDERGGGSRSGTSSGGSSGSSSSSAYAGAKSYRLPTALERLPEGLPSWFASKDLNGDGQVAMAEFSTAWSEAVVAEFAKNDKNGDGFITPQELLGTSSSGSSGSSYGGGASSSGSSGSSFGGLPFGTPPGDGRFGGSFSGGSPGGSSNGSSSGRSFGFGFGSRGGDSRGGDSRSGESRGGGDFSRDQFQRR